MLETRTPRMLHFFGVRFNGSIYISWRADVIYDTLVCCLRLKLVAP